MSSTTCLPSSKEVAQQPVLHVEARVKGNRDGIIVRTDLIRDEVTQWLTESFIVLSLGQEIHSFDGLREPYAQALDSITVTECTGGDLESGAYHLQNVELDVQAYQLRAQFDNEGSQHTQQVEGATDIGEDSGKISILMLPNKEFDGLWESYEHILRRWRRTRTENSNRLHYDQPLQSTLLRAISRMVSFAAKRLDKWTINWNRLILLWGPPGTGKTSLCRGLSQKLAIRLGKHYPQSKLLEINAHSLGSKFFGESGKLVSNAFENIELLLEEEEDTFICVFIDEIETLAARRERALSGNEPFDAVRAVNALLTGLDRLKQHHNVVVICTSNLVTALDQAFLDRVDIKQFVPHLSGRAIYGIYKECLEELSRRGIVEGASFDIVQANPEDPLTALQYVEQAGDFLVLPIFDEMLLNYQMFSDAVPKLLADAAYASVGLSGRTIRRLPAISIVLHSNRARCNVRHAIQTLEMCIASEIQAKAEAM